MTSSSIAIKVLLVNCAPTSILASKQEHTTTLYLKRVFHGGRANLSASTSVKSARFRTVKLVDEANTQQYCIILLGTSANVLF